MSFPFDNSYRRLPEAFYRSCEPTPVASPSLLRVNRPLAGELGLPVEDLDDQALADLFSGNRLPDGAEPIAMAYAGHQFGGFSPQLGDGRAILLGEVIDQRGRRRDIQLKGAGRTPFSRGGDGRAPLGPVIREYLVSEAMHALGVPTTRALAAVTTGEPVFREDTLPGAVLTRVASSHIRIGTFEFLAARRDKENLRVLADHVIQRHYPDLAGSSNPYLRLLDSVIRRQASLVAHWMSIGFIHGVMNTDNMSVSGETIDYGPCAFLDTYHPETVFSSIDTGGRYAYRMQPAVAQWNLARLAECLIPLIDPDQERAIELATATLGEFTGYYQRQWLTRMRAKIGLTEEREDDQALIEDLLARMTANKVDFTLLFHRLAEVVEQPDDDTLVRDLFSDGKDWEAWSARWTARLADENVPATERAAHMRGINPAVIPRNHAIEKAIEAAINRQDMAPFETLNAILAQPFTETSEGLSLLGPPADNEQVYQTFCGT